MLLGALAGADMFGHCGICGTDHGASLAWLYFDNETANYVNRIARGFEVDKETLATEVVNTVGPGGNFLAEEHTVQHFRRELWLTGPAWTRQSFDGWESQGGKSFAEQIADEVERILSTHKAEPIDEGLAREVDKIVESARRELS